MSFDTGTKEGMTATRLAILGGISEMSPGRQADFKIATKAIRHVVENAGDDVGKLALSIVMLEVAIDHAHE